MTRRYPIGVLWAMLAAFAAAGDALAENTTSTPSAEAPSEAPSRTRSYPAPDAPFGERAEYIVRLGFASAQLNDADRYDFTPDSSAFDSPFHVGAAVELASAKPGRHARFGLLVESLRDQQFGVLSVMAQAGRSLRAAKGHNPWRYVEFRYGAGVGLQRIENDRANAISAAGEVSLGVGVGLSRVALELEGFARQGLTVGFNGDDRAPFIHGIRFSVVHRVGHRRWR